MKKIITIVLSVAMVLAISLSLFACGSSELKGLTYKDAEGKEQKVDVKKTDDPNLTAQSISAISTKEVDNSEVKSILVTASVDMAASATTDGKTVSNDLKGSLTIGANVPTITDDTTLESLLKSIAPYIKVVAKGNLSLDQEDLSKVTALDESAEVLFADSSLFAKIVLSDALKTQLTTRLRLMGVNVNDYVGKYIKLDAKSLIQSASSAIPYNQIKAAIKVATDKGASLDKIVGAFTKSEDTEEATMNYNDVLEFVKKYGIVISSTNRSKVTFRVNLSKETAKDLIQLPMIKVDLSSYEGNSYVDVTLDVANMRITNITADGTGIINAFAKSGVLNENGEDSKTTYNVSKLVVSLNVEYNKAVPTISEKDRTDATVVKIPTLPKMPNLDDINIPGLNDYPFDDEDDVVDGEEDDVVVIGDEDGEADENANGEETIEG